jgi:hypothetical protein
VGGFISGWTGESGEALVEIGKKIDLHNKWHPTSRLHLTGIVDDYSNSFMGKIESYINKCSLDFKILWNSIYDFPPNGQGMSIRAILSIADVFKINVGILLSGGMDPGTANKFSSAAKNSLVIELGGG